MVVGRWDHWRCMARSRRLTRALERRAAAAERAADEREREAEAGEEGDRKEPAAALLRRGDESRRANQGEEVVCSSVSFPLSRSR
jgi:hypothetical protein